MLIEQLFFVAKDDAGKASDPRAEVEELCVGSAQLVGIARYIWTWPDEAHLAD